MKVTQCRILLKMLLNTIYSFRQYILSLDSVFISRTARYFIVEKKKMPAVGQDRCPALYKGTSPSCKIHSKEHSSHLLNLMPLVNSCHSAKEKLFIQDLKSIL